MEGQTRTIKLPDEDPQLVTHYLSYTYGKCLPTDIFTANFLGTFPDEADDYYQLLAELYAVGERLLDDSIRASLIKEFVRLAELTDKDSKRHFPMKGAVNTIYRSTTAGCPARRLMVDFHVAHAKVPWLDSTCDAAFVLEVAQSVYAKLEENGGGYVSSARSLSIEAVNYLS